jgi:sodium/hydrogen exchanger 8
MAFGSLISATDPVSIITAFKEYDTDPNFFSIVLGESILNDAISIVFYETTLRYETDESIVYTIFSGMLYFVVVIISSIIIGYLIGYLSALFLSLISGKVKDIHKFEIGIMMILPWVSYLVAQVNFYLIKLFYFLLNKF